MIAEGTIPAKCPTVCYFFMLKFDDAGKWKVVKTQHLSEKEVRRRTVTMRQSRQIWLGTILILLFFQTRLRRQTFRRSGRSSTPRS